MVYSKQLKKLNSHEKYNRSRIYPGVGFCLIYQTDTSKIVQYCQVIAVPRLFSNKVTIDIDFAEEKNFWTDNRQKSYDGKFNKCNTVIDALNFMRKKGWVFINAYLVTIDNGT